MGESCVPHDWLPPDGHTVDGNEGSARGGGRATALESARDLLAEELRLAAFKQEVAVGTRGQVVTDLDAEILGSRNQGTSRTFANLSGSPWKTTPADLLGSPSLNSLNLRIFFLFLFKAKICVAGVEKNKSQNVLIGQCAKSS